MRKTIFSFSLLLAVSFVSSLQAEEEHAYQSIQVPPSAEFDQIKTLVGVWEGTTTDMGKGPTEAKAEYKLTSAGSAVVEVLFPGTKHQMHSIYFNQKGKLTMLHYCALGNRPVLELEKHDASGILLNFSAKSEIDVQKEPHMHALKISMPDSNTLVQEWTYYENGKPAGTTLINLKRIS